MIRLPVAFNAFEICYQPAGNQAAGLSSSRLASLIVSAIICYSLCSISVFLEERLILLLCFDEGFLEKIGIWKVPSAVSHHRVNGKRRQTLAIGEANCKRACFGLAVANIGCRIPYPASIATDVGRKFHVRHD